MSLLVFTKLKSFKHNSHLVTVLKTQNKKCPATSILIKKMFFAVEKNGGKNI